MAEPRPPEAATSINVSGGWHDDHMVRLLRPFGRAVTYTRWLHLFIATVWPAMWMFVEEAWWTWLVAAATLAVVHDRIGFLPPLTP